MTKKRSPVPEMRGVSAFLSTTVEQASDSTTSVSIEKIRLPSKQPRRYFDPEKLSQLTESIKQHGILEPLLVRPMPNGEYELVAGERRYKAAQIVQLKEVPITVKELSDQEALQVALIENLQREDLNPIEETESILELLTLKLECNKNDILNALTQMATAQKKGITLSGNVSRQIEVIAATLAFTIGLTPESFRTSRVPLLSLPSDVLESIRQGKLEYTKARLIARLENEQHRQSLLKEAIEQNLSLTQIKQRIKELTSTDSSNSPTISDRLTLVSRKLREKKVLNDPRKQKKLEKLLKELEQLVED